MLDPNFESGSNWVHSGLKTPFFDLLEFRPLLRLSQPRDAGGGGGRVGAPQVLGYQLTLFGPRGQIMPAILLPCPPIILDDAAFLISNYIPS